MDSVRENKTFDLDLNSEAFNAFKADFNAMLKAILSGMEKNEAENGEINVTMKIGLEERDIVDRGYTRSAMVPSFSHKVVSKMQFKNEKKGSLTGNFVLKFDKKSGKYYLEEVQDGQTSFFDDGSTAEEVHDMGEVIDAEFTDVQTSELHGSNVPLLEVSNEEDEFEDGEEDEYDDEDDDFDGVSYDDEDGGKPDDFDIDSIDPDKVPF